MDSPPLPTAPTFSYIADLATKRPSGTAVIDGGREISYQTFHRDVSRMIGVFQELGLGHRGTVALECPERYDHWVMLLALEALGVLTFSYSPDQAETFDELLGMIDLVICTEGSEPKKAKRIQRLDEAWMTTVLSQDSNGPINLPTVNLDAPARVVRSSGTTGDYKWMAHTVRVRESRTAEYISHAKFTPRSRFLMVMGFAMQSFSAYMTGCLRTGGICVFPDGESIAEALKKYAITHVTLLPHTVVQVLDALPDGYVKTPNLTIFTNGGPISNAVQDRVKRHLADNLVNCYGGNEMGPVTLIGQDNIGTIVPGAHVEVVDETGESVIGEAGRVRVRGPGVVPGYLLDSQATADIFQEGWFYPGDVGILISEDRLELVGRVDDLLNIGGLKYAPHKYEEMLRNELPLRDICLLAHPNADGVAQVWAAVVPNDSIDAENIGIQIAQHLPAQLGKVNIAVTDQIPRTETGKAQRAKLSALLDKV